MRRIAALLLMAVVGIAVSALLVDAARISPSSRFPGWTLTPVAAFCHWSYYPSWLGGCAKRNEPGRHAALRQ